MKKVILVILLIFSFTHLYSQEEDSISEDIDSVFTEEGTVEGEVSIEEDTDLLKTIMMGEPFTLGADFLFIGGYSPGLNYLPYDVADLSDIQYADKFILKFNSSVSLNVQFSPELRVYNKIAVRFPDFLLEVSELFCDYNLADIIFLRLGRQNVTWGISRNYQFTNLLARLPELTTNNENADSFTFKMNIPIGTGGFETIAFSRDSFWTGDTPYLNDIGFGGKLNLAFDFLDFNVGGFFHEDMNLRFFYSVKTTLFGFIEAYTEGLIAMEQNWIVSGPDLYRGFSANAGVYVDFLDQAVQVNAEYFYNGEQTEQEIKADPFPMIPGHNVALNLSFAFLDRKLKILLQGKYNISEFTGMIIPAVTFSAFPNLTFSLAIPLIIGPTTGIYFTENEEYGQRRIGLVLAIILKGSL